MRQPKCKPLVIAVRDVVDIGRDCDGLLLSDPEVSRRHVSLRLDGDAVVLEDLGSTNGTMLNGSKIDGAVTLEEGDVALLGRTELQLLAATGRTRAARKPMPISRANQTCQGKDLKKEVAEEIGEYLVGFCYKVICREGKSK